MKLLSVLSVFVMLFSCSEHDAGTEEELLAVNAKTEQYQDGDNYLYGPDVYIAIAGRELDRLEEIKVGFLAQIDKGNDESINALETVLKEISQYEALIELIGFIRPPKFPRPPKGCIQPESRGCRLEIDSIEAILLVEGIKLHKIEFKGTKNTPFDTSYERGESSLGEPVLFFKSEFQGNATMYFTIETEELGEMVIPLDVIRD